MLQTNFRHGKEISNGFLKDRTVQIIFRALVAGWQKQKAGGRIPQPASFAGQAGLCRRSLVRVGGLWGDGKGPPLNRSEFLSMRYTLSTTYHMMKDKFARKNGLKSL